MYDMMYLAKEQLGWSKDEFLASTPIFFKKMIDAKIRALGRGERDKVKTYQYLDDVPEDLR